jgi:glutaminyl-tRNA synthetase
MAVLNPLKVIITDYAVDQEEIFNLPVHPKNPEMGTRSVPFCRELYIEADDFLENPPKKFFRLSPGREVRLRGAYLVTCTEVVKDPSTGEITEVHCTHDPASRGGDAPDGRKVKGTLHWVSARHAMDIEVRLYDRLFSVPFPTADKEKDFKQFLNQNSLCILTGCKSDPSLAHSLPGQGFQFERQGFFCRDSQDNDQGVLVFNRTVTLRDSWAKKK